MKHSVSRAFTLVELLVVLGIFMVITGTILANHTRFNSSVLLGSLAYDMALSVRQAQVYGLSVQTFGTRFSATGYDIQVGYGIHLSSAAPGSYILFADQPPANDRYDAGEAIQTYTLSLNHSIASFCGTLSAADGGGSQCSTDVSNPPTYLDIVFFRPNPDANILSDQLPAGHMYSSASIVVRSSQGETRTITVQSTGQISVTNP